MILGSIHPIYFTSAWEAQPFVPVEMIFSTVVAILVGIIAGLIAGISIVKIRKKFNSVWKSTHNAYLYLVC